MGRAGRHRAKGRAEKEPFPRESKARAEPERGTEVSRVRGKMRRAGRPKSKKRAHDLEKLQLELA